MNLEEIIFDLCSVQGVSGNETAALDRAREYLEPLAEEAFSDSNGNFFAVLGSSKADKTILLDAHLDRIGFIITGFDDSEADSIALMDEFATDELKLNFDGKKQSNVSILIFILLNAPQVSNKHICKFLIKFNIECSFTLLVPRSTFGNNHITREVSSQNDFGSINFKR